MVLVWWERVEKRCFFFSKFIDYPSTVNQVPPRAIRLCQSHDSPSIPSIPSTPSTPSIYLDLAHHHPDLPTHRLQLLCTERKLQSSSHVHARTVYIPMHQQPCINLQEAYPTLRTILQTLQQGLEDCPLNQLTVADHILPSEEEQQCIVQVQSYLATTEFHHVAYHPAPILPVPIQSGSRCSNKFPPFETLTYWWTTAQQAIQRRAPNNVSYWSRVLMTDVALVLGVATWVAI